MATSSPWTHTTGPFPVAGPGDQDLATTTRLSNGNVLVAWIEGHAGSFGGWTSASVVAQVFTPDGQAASAPMDITPASFSWAFGDDIAVAPLADGGFALVWLQTTAGAATTSEIYAQRLDASGVAVGGAMRVNTDTLSAYPDSFDVVSLVGGGFAVTWGRQGDVGRTVRSFDAHGLPSGSPYLVGNDQPATSTTGLLYLAETNYGGLVAVWDENANGSSTQNTIHFQHLDAQGTRLESPQWAGSQPGWYMWELAGAALPGGRTAVVEETYRPDTGRASISVVTMDAHDNAIAAMTINEDALYLDVTALADGGFLVAWVTGQSEMLRAQRFDADGHAVTEAFTVFSTPNHGLTSIAGGGGRVPFEVTATADGGATIVWDYGTGSSTEGTDVYMVHYGPETAMPTPVLPSAPQLPTKLTGGSESDLLAGTRGNDVFTGGGGTDTVAFTGAWSQYGLFHASDGFVISGPDGTDSLTGVERLQFADVDVALDTGSNGGMAYRLYQAAFDRAPDSGGLGYHIHDLDVGVPMVVVAQHFIESPEFQGKYGALDDRQFITQLYLNVLHRAPEEAGLQYHLGEFAQGQSRADMLTHFSESAENQANVIGQIQDGMVYLPLV